MDPASTLSLSLSLSLGAHENYTPIKLFSHLSPGIRLERTNSAIILIREEKMEIRAAGCCCFACMRIIVG
jgi:hypothetical protein